MARLLSICLYVLASTLSQVYAQSLSTKNKKAIFLYKESENYRVRHQFSLAIESLSKACKADKNFFEAYFQQGVIYNYMKNYPKAVELFLQSLNSTRDDKRLSFVYFLLAENYMLVGDYKKTLEFVNRYLATSATSSEKWAKAKLMKSSAEFALQNINNDIHIQLNELSDTVNFFRTQYFPVLTADEEIMIFTKRNGVGVADDEDLVFTRKDKLGRWTYPESISPNINTKLNEGTCSVSADGHMIIFTSCEGRKGAGGCDLFESKKIGNEWTEPVNLGTQINSSAWESQPSLSADGRRLYFVSDRDGGMGNRDIYVSYKSETSGWSKAENLGKNINTPFDEISPFIHANGSTLYFASNGWIGFGGYDIFKSELKSGSWSRPENIGYPINKYDDQFSLFVTPDGKHGYYSHEDNLTRSKIIEFDFPVEMRNSSISNYVKGTVRDKNTLRPLSARVELFDLDTKQLSSLVVSDSISGEYLIVSTNGANYGLYVSKSGYLFYSVNFNYLKDNDFKPMVLDVLLEPVEVGASIVLNNIFFDFEKYNLNPNSTIELDKVTRFLLENSKSKIEISGHTDNIGTESSNYQLSLLRSQSVAEYLQNHGVSSQRLIQKGYGDKQPIKPNDTETNRQMNRRIELKIIK